MKVFLFYFNLSFLKSGVFGVCACDVACVCSMYVKMTDFFSL